MPINPAACTFGLLLMGLALRPHDAAAQIRAHAWAPLQEVGINDFPFSSSGPVGRGGGDALEGGGLTRDG